MLQLIEFPIVVAKNDTVRYIPPEQGVLTLNIADGFTHKKTYRVISSTDRKFINSLAEQSGDLINMTAFGVQNYKIRLEEALGLVDSMMKESSNRIYILGKVLPQVSKPVDARQLMNKVLGYNKLECARLRRELGFMVKPLLGNSDGRYCLDLSKDNDRLCLNKLLEITKTIAHFRCLKRNKLGYGKLGDVSQKGNWTGFRNELFNGKPITITTDFASPLPRTGRVEFDFISDKRCSLDDIILSDIRVVNMLIKLYQIHPDERALALKRLKISKIKTDTTLKGNSVTIYECSDKRAREIGIHMQNFYDNLPLRTEQIDKSKMLENVKVRYSIEDELAKRVANGETGNITAFNANDFLTIPSILSIQPVNFDLEKKGMEVKSSSPPMERKKSSWKAEEIKSLVQTVNMEKTLEQDEDNDSSVHHSDEDDKPEDNLSPGVTSVDHSKFGKRKIDEWMIRYVKVMGSSNIQGQAKAARTLDVLIEAFEHSFIMARHLELMCDMFQEFGTIKHSELFGTYRVELVVNLFSNVVDLYNFEIVMRTLTSFEAACVICRVGWLRIFNPMKPEGAYELELSRREEKIMLKAFTTLSVNEPGENFATVSFRWMRDMSPMPGFEVTEPWMTEEGLPHKGLFK